MSNVTIFSVVGLYVIASIGCWSFFEYDFDPPPWPIRGLIAFLWPVWLTLIGFVCCSNFIEDKWREYKRKRQPKDSSHAQR